MASTQQGAPVDAPQVVEPTRSLLTTLQALRRIQEGSLSVAAPEVDETAVERGDEVERPTTGRPPAWLRSGIRFDPDDCSSGQVYDPVCNVGGAPLDTISNGETENADVLSARIGVECSVGGDLDGDEIRDKARRTMQVCQHGLIGAEFWRGDLVRAEGHPNRFLSSADAVTILDGQALPVVGAVALVESALAGLPGPAAEQSCGCGERGMIHVSPIVFAAMARFGLIRYEGGLALSPSDHYVVTGPGYDGSGPSGGYEPDTTDPATDFIYGTGLLDLRLGPARLTSDVDPDTNSRRVFVDRPFVVAMGGCCHVATEVDLSTIIADQG